MQKQFEKKRIKRVIKFRFKYYAMRSNSASKATIFTTQIKTFISFESLTNDNFKKKLKCSTNANCFLNVIKTQKNTIANYLVKKSKLNSILLSLISMSTLIKSSINKVDVSQVYKI